MTVDFDIPNKLKKDDLLIYNGKKFQVINLTEIKDGYINIINDLKHDIVLLEQKINKLKLEQSEFIKKSKNELTNVIFDMIEEVAKR